MTVERETVIQWYPGHMATAMRKLDDSMKMIDVVIEVIDARAPASGANPFLLELIGKRPRLVVLAREDLADPSATVRWMTAFNADRIRSVAVNAKDQNSVSKAAFHLNQLVSDRKGNSRAMVIGIPNAGKSSVINGLLRRVAAKAEDRAGVTRSVQWFRVGPKLELMDTPGILVPKIESADGQWMLAMVGAIPRERYDPEDVVGRFHRWLKAKTENRTRVPDLDTFATTRRFIRQGGELDLHNAALSYIKDFNDAKFGRITFELPPDPVKE